jgi:uncharacterized protein (DUF1778 family)
MPTATHRRHVALRIPEADLERIDQLAHDLGLNRTEYLISAATREQTRPIARDEPPREIYLEERFAEISSRLTEVELHVSRLRGLASPAS